MGGLFSSVSEASGVMVEGMMYQPPQPTQEDVKIQKESTIAGIPVLFIPCMTANRKYLVFFHGNGTSVGRMKPTLDKLSHDLQISVIAPEYYGYAGRPGPPSTLKIRQEVDLLWQRLMIVLKPSDIIVAGQSIGSGPACYCAARYSPAAVWLFSPLYSVGEAANELVSSAASAVVPDAVEWNNSATLPLYSNPEGEIVVIVGEKDSLTTVQSCQNLMILVKKAKRVKTAVLYALEDMDHNLNISDPVIVDYVLRGKGHSELIAGTSIKEPFLLDIFDRKFET